MYNYNIIKNIFVLLILFVLAYQPSFANESIHFEIVPFNNNQLNKEILQNINTQLTIQNQFIHQVGSYNISSIAQQGKENVRKAMEPFGYFKPIITFSIHNVKKQWRITYFIQLGPPLKIKHLDLALFGPGQHNPVLKSFIQHFPLKIGDIFETNKYNQAKESLVSIANNQGYIKNVMQENKIYIYVKSNQVFIIIHLQTGPQYYFGEITFTQHPSYDQQFLKRFVLLSPNQVFSVQKLANLQKQMSSSEYFQQVHIMPDFEKMKNDRVPVEVNVIPPKPKRYQIGVGYGSLTGPRLIAGMNFHRITDMEHHFDAQLKLSSVLSAFSAKYFIPGHNPLTDQWIIGANTQIFLPSNGSSRGETISVGHLKKEDHFQISMDLNYLIEKYKTETNPTKINELLYPNLTIFYVNSDNVTHPLYGQSINFSLRGAAKNAYSSTNFLQSEIKGKYLFSPTLQSHVIVRGMLGYTLVHDIQNLPLSMRFFTGGTNTIRGYKESSIGPGRYLAVGSLEYQHHMINDWSAALFYDAGNSANHWTNSLYRSGGIGIIYESLVGPIKVYAAKALDRPSHVYSIEFSIGPEF